MATKMDRANSPVRRPQAHVTVPAAGDHLKPIRAEIHSIDKSAVTAEPDRPGRSIDVPHLGLVPARSGHVAATSAEVHRPDRPSLPRQDNRRRRLIDPTHHHYTVFRRPCRQLGSLRDSMRRVRPGRQVSLASRGQPNSRPPNPSLGARGVSNIVLVEDHRPYRAARESDHHSLVVPPRGVTQCGPRFPFCGARRRQPRREEASQCRWLSARTERRQGKSHCTRWALLADLLARERGDHASLVGHGLAPRNLRLEGRPHRRYSQATDHEQQQEARGEGQTKSTAAPSPFLPSQNWQRIGRQAVQSSNELGDGLVPLLGGTLSPPPHHTEASQLNPIPVPRYVAESARKSLLGRAGREDYHYPASSPTRFQEGIDLTNEPILCAIGAQTESLRRRDYNEELRGPQVRQYVVVPEVFACPAKRRIQKDFSRSEQIPRDFRRQAIPQLQRRLVVLELGAQPARQRRADWTTTVG